jgi:hypothetical protein
VSLEQSISLRGYHLFHQEIHLNHPLSSEWSNPGIPLIRLIQVSKNPKTPCFRFFSVTPHMEVEALTSEARSAMPHLRFLEAQSEHAIPKIVEDALD